MINRRDYLLGTISTVGPIIEMIRIILDCDYLPIHMPDILRMIMKMKIDKAL
jgi:hypothetical protein